MRPPIAELTQFPDQAAFQRAETATENRIPLVPHDGQQTESIPMNDRFRAGRLMSQVRTHVFDPGALKHGTQFPLHKGNQPLRQHFQRASHMLLVIRTRHDNTLRVRPGDINRTSSRGTDRRQVRAHPLRRLRRSRTASIACGGTVVKRLRHTGGKMP